MIDPSTVEKIYAAANIVDIVSDFISLKKKGVNYTACCPFHNEKTPSFIVSPAKGIFKCFGCGKSGNAVTFVMEHEQMTYPDALKYVAKRYGIPIEEHELSPSEQLEADRRQNILTLNQYAKDYFAQQLHTSPQGQSVALSYLRERGISDLSIEQFGLGYCPDGGDAFSVEALRNGYREEYLTETGLSIKRDSGGFYDRFCGRVMFPIHSVSGQIIGFGGRIMRSDKKTAKYLNSPESSVYHKSDTLYGLFLAKNSIVQKDNCILVEGYTDVISMHQNGVTNVVASSGTSLTEGQIAMIKRFTLNVTVIYDGDFAGIKASMRGIDMILKAGLNVRIVPLPDGEDPDSFARSRSAEALAEYLEQHSEDFMSFKTDTLLADAKADPIARARVIHEIVESIAVIPDPITRQIYTQECSRRMEVDERTLDDEVRRRVESARLTPEERPVYRENLRYQELKKRSENPVFQSSRIGDTSPALQKIYALEREILKYLLRYGHEWYTLWVGGEKVRHNVAADIIYDIDRDSISLKNEVYDRIYCLYTDAWYARCEELAHENGISSDQSEVLELLENSGWRFDSNKLQFCDDPQVCTASIQLLNEGLDYVLSKLWELNSITTENERDRLYEAIPRALKFYKTQIIETLITQFRLEMSQAENEAQIDSVFEKIALLVQKRREVCEQYDRIRI